MGVRDPGVQLSFLHPLMPCSHTTGAASSLVTCSPLTLLLLF